MRYAMISFLVLMLWVMPFRYYYVCKVKNHCHEAIQTKTPQPQTISVKRPYQLNLIDGDSIVLKDFQQFYFPDNQASSLLTPNNEAFLDLVTAYLISHPKKKLIVSAQVGDNYTGESKLARERVVFVLDQILQRGIKKRQLIEEISLMKDSMNTDPVSFKIAGL